MKHTTLLSAFENYLRNKIRWTEKYIPFYVCWVRVTYETAGVPLKQSLPEKNKKAIFKAFSHSHPDWQLRQAEDALHHYPYFVSQNRDAATDPPSQPLSASWRQVVGKTR